MLESKILIVSHCLLNKSTRWWQENKPPERNMGLAAEIIKFASKRSLGIIQMPCPEFTFCGNPRPSRTKDEYEMLPGFKEHCDTLAKLVAEQMKTMVLLGRSPRIHILAVIGVKRSPSCAVRSAMRRMNAESICSEEKGIFIEVLEREISKTGLKLHFLEFDFESPNEIISDLKRLLYRS